MKTLTTTVLKYNFEFFYLFVISQGTRTFTISLSCEKHSNLDAIRPWGDKCIWWLWLVMSQGSTHGCVDLSYQFQKHQMTLGKSQWWVFTHLQLISMCNSVCSSNGKDLSSVFCRMRLNAQHAHAWIKIYLSLHVAF
jgi:hypothetical protein